MRKQQGTLLGQLDRLVSVIDLPTVELGIVPFPVMPVMPVMPVSSFYTHDEIVYIETLTAEQQLAEPDEVAVYVKAFNLLREAAVSGLDVISSDPPCRLRAAPGGAPHSQSYAGVTLGEGKQRRRRTGSGFQHRHFSLPNAAPAGLSVDYRRPVPLLSADDPLLHRPRRVLVAGTSGSGKTTLARGVAEVLGIPHIEIDALVHGPGWTPRESFVADVDAFSTTPEWGTEWQYSLVRNLLAARADLLIWLDLPRATVMRQVVGRTLRRRLRREVLWNGNVEPPLWSFYTDRDHVVRWAWSTHHKSALRVAELRKQRPELTITRLSSHAKARQWLAGPLLLATTRPPQVS